MKLHFIINRAVKIALPNNNMQTDTSIQSIMKNPMDLRFTICQAKSTLFTFAYHNPKVRNNKSSNIENRCFTTWLWDCSCLTNMTSTRHGAIRVMCLCMQWNSFMVQLFQIYCCTNDVGEEASKRYSWYCGRILSQIFLNIIQTEQ